MKIVITGGSGRAGQAIVPELITHGHEVANADMTRGPDQGARFMSTDATDLGQVVTATKGADAIIHMAANKGIVDSPEHELFRINMVSNWNVLEAAEIHGIGKVVMASSVNAVGGIFSPAPMTDPEYLPIDEQVQTRAADGYAQSKWLGEGMADAFCRRRELQIASMRFHWLVTTQMRETAQAQPLSDPSGSDALHFWGWTDNDDAAQACRLAIERDWSGHEVFFINADDTRLTIPTMDAIAQAYPNVPVNEPLQGFASAIDNAKAKAMLGWSHPTTWER
jgi:nucleoside-diphosphate-sugar epimerase